jgi:hypothetical protein
MFGPVSSGYPGKYPLFAATAFVMGLYIFAIIRFRGLKRVRFEDRIIHKEDFLKQESLIQILGLGAFCAFLVGVFLWEVYRHWPN